MDPAQPSLRKPPRATLEQKIRILDHHHQHERPQSETVERFKNEVAISTSTFNEWLKREQDYRARYAQSESQFEKHARRKITYKYDKINRAMDLLVQQRMESGEDLSEPVLRNYWQIYAHQFGVDNPKRLTGFSHGWLSQFKKRHGLSRPKPKPAIAAGSAEITQNPQTPEISGNSSNLANLQNSQNAVEAETAEYSATEFGESPRLGELRKAGEFSKPDDSVSAQFDPTSTNNKKLLADSAQSPRERMQDMAISQLASPSEQGENIGESQGHFRPQKTLSFPQPLAYLSPGTQHSNGSQTSVGSGSIQRGPHPAERTTGSVGRSQVDQMGQINQIDQINQMGQMGQIGQMGQMNQMQINEIGQMDRIEIGEIQPSQSGQGAAMEPQSLESAMQLSLARDMERFFADTADRFFRHHKYDFPQTLQLYEEFKASFYSERLITLRSSQVQSSEHGHSHAHAHAGHAINVNGSGNANGSASFNNLNNLNVNANVNGHGRLGHQHQHQHQHESRGGGENRNENSRGPLDQVPVSTSTPGSASASVPVSVLNSNDASPIFPDPEMGQLQTRKRRDMGTHAGLANAQNQQNLETLQNLHLHGQSIQGFENQGLQSLRSRQRSRSGQNLLAMQRMRSSSRTRVSHRGQSSQMGPIGSMGSQITDSSGSNMALMGASSERNSSSSSSPEDQAMNRISQQQQQQQYQYRRNSHHASNQGSGESRSQSRSRSQGRRDYPGHSNHQILNSHTPGHSSRSSDRDQTHQGLGPIERPSVQPPQRQHGYRSEEGVAMDVNVGEAGIDDLFLSQARQGIQGMQGIQEMDIQRIQGRQERQERQGRQGRQLGRETYTEEPSWSNSESRKLWEQNKLMLS